MRRQQFMLLPLFVNKWSFIVVRKVICSLRKIAGQKLQDKSVSSLQKGMYVRIMVMR